MKNIKLLANGNTNAKTAKNARESAIMYLAPHTQNSFNVNVCALATDGCILACLYKAGRGAFNSIQQARIRKTDFYISEKKQFIEQLEKEIQSINKRSEKKGIKTAIRLNGTSDLDLLGQIKRKVNDDILNLDNVQYYDYTKILGKVKKYIGTNYRLCFSFSGDNWSDCEEALKIGAPVSVVFSADSRKKEPLPKTYKGYKVIDGDKADDLMLDHKGSYILGLRFKGSKKAKQEAIKSNFVIER